MKKLLHISKIFVLVLFVLGLLFTVGCGEKEPDEEDNPVGGEVDPGTDPDSGEDPKPDPDDDKTSAEKLLDKVLAELGNEAIDEVKLPKTDKELGGTIEWASSNNELFDPESGLLDIVEFDEKVSVTCKVTLDGQTAEKTIEFTVIGWSLYDIYKDFSKQIKGTKVFADWKVETEYDDYGGTTVTWTTSNEDILDKTGKFTQPSKPTS